VACNPSFPWPVYFSCDGKSGRKPASRRRGCFLEALSRESRSHTASASISSLLFVAEEEEEEEEEEEDVWPCSRSEEGKKEELSVSLCESVALLGDISATTEALNIALKVENINECAMSK